MFNTAFGKTRYQAGSVTIPTANPFTGQKQVPVELGGIYYYNARL